MAITKDSENLYSSMRFVGDGVTKRVPLTFDLREGDGLAVDFGEGLVTDGYLIDHDVTPVVVLFSDPLPLDKTITIRRLTKIDAVRHIFQSTGNAQGGSDFTAKNIDENFEQITRASQDAMDSQVLASETLEEMAGIRDDAIDARDKAKVSETNAKQSEVNSKDSELKAKVSETNAKSSELASKGSEELARKWATNPVDIPVSGGEYSAYHWAEQAKKNSASPSKFTLIQAGGGLTGGGSLEQDRTITLGTPTKITATSTNSVTDSSHTHAIDKATLTQAGILQLTNTIGNSEDKGATPKGVWDFVKSELDKLIPVGTTHIWLTGVAPEGYLFAKGQVFSATQYPKLAQLFPDLRLPDFRGVVPRGLDDGRGLDSGRVLGSYQADAMQLLEGSVGAVYRATDIPSQNTLLTLAAYGNTPARRSTLDLDPGGSVSINFSNRNVARVSDENRMKNIAVNFIIKAG